MKFAAGLVLLGYLPGRAILALFRLRPAGLERFVLSLTVGMAASPAVNKFVRIAGAEWAFALWIAAAGMVVLAGIVRRPPRLEASRFRPTAAAAVLAAVLALVFAMLAVDSFDNARPGPDGSLVVKMHYYDGFIRQAVIRELGHDIPPEMPFAAGNPLGYHYGMDLFIALFERYLGLDVWDLVHRLLAPVFWILLALSAFLLGREISRSDAAGVLASFLVVFGSGGWSWVADLARGAPIGGNPFYALYLFDGLGVNSLIPGLAVLLSGFFALSRYLRERRAGWLCLAALLLALSVEFKVFFAGPVIGTLAVTGLIAVFRWKDKALLLAAGATAAVMAPLLLTAIMGHRGGLSYTFAFRLNDWPERVLIALNLDSILGSSAGGLAAGFLLLLAGSFGPSVLALPGVVLRFFARSRESGIAFFLSGLLAACVLYFFVFSITIGGLPRHILNIYAFYLGLVLLLIFFADAVARFAAPRSRPVRFAIYAAVVILCLPNTVLFLRAKIRAPELRAFPAAFVETARWLNGNVPATSVILQPLAVRYLSFLGGRRLVLDDTVHSYLPFHLTADEISRRRDAVNRFFANPFERAEVLSTYRVTHVVVPHDQAFPAEGEDGTIRLGNYVLRKLFDNGGFRVFAVGRSIY